MARRDPREHVPTKEQRQIVELAAVIGIPHHDICKLIGITTKTLLKHYRKELDTGKTRATLKVGGSLYSSAIKGNVAAQIFWMKAQAGWRETPISHEHSGPGGKPIGVASLTGAITDEEALKAYLMLVSERPQETAAHVPRKT